MKIQRLFLLSFVLLLAQVADAQRILDGLVLDRETLEPIIGATVSDGAKGKPLAVTNADSATITGFHNRGFKSYAIAKMKTDKDTWLKDYAYTAEYTFTFGEYSFPMSTDTYRVPNEWILDAVNLSLESVFQWIVTSSALDAGWTYCGKEDKDPERYNKAVIRKQDANGKYVDSNNSTNDFNAEVKPSMMK